MKIRKTSDGQTYLHIWRQGTAYESQKKLIFHSEWTNIKFTLLPSQKSEYINHYDIRRPLQFPDETFDAVYANHILEHLTPDEGKNFILEIYRVLKVDGICRVVVPDLESQCIEYLKHLEGYISEPSEENIRKYHWSVLELVDQLVRDKSGGLLLELLKNGDFDLEFVRARSGDVFSEFCSPRNPEAGLTKRILSKKPKELFYALQRRLKLLIVKGDPRKTAEAHKWMYDRLSLKLLLEKEGFEHFSVKSFATSDIGNWERYNFDKSDYGEYPLEPSRYVECKKPLKT